MSRTMRMLITVVFAALMSLGMATVALAAHGGPAGDCAEEVAGIATEGAEGVVAKLIECSSGV